ncbi:MAG: lipid-binding SYLF domain-containing protein [Acetobacteraceae bacterium]|nr:lipid-binding SYLF domain-containing protein [Acetobacteraceae bacterium]
MHGIGRRRTLAALLAAGTCLSTQAAFAQAEEQALVDQATLTVNEILGDPNFKDGIELLRKARAAMIIPRKFRAGFIIGGEGGGGVLLGRDGSGSWTSPAFFGTGAGSLGLQIGVQDAQVIMLIMNDKALNAILDSQFKFGADASLAVATLGAGIAGATTSALGADIVTISKTRGLFAGAALEGTVLSSRSEWNKAYFGREVSARQIVIGAEVHNPAADGLRAALMRFSQS